MKIFTANIFLLFINFIFMQIKSSLFLLKIIILLHLRFTTANSLSYFIFNWFFENTRNQIIAFKFLVIGLNSFKHLWKFKIFHHEIDGEIPQKVGPLNYVKRTVVHVFRSSVAKDLTPPSKIIWMPKTCTAGTHVMNFYKVIQYYFIWGRIAGQFNARKNSLLYAAW